MNSTANRIRPKVTNAGISASWQSSGARDAPGDYGESVCSFQTRKWRTVLKALNCRRTGGARPRPACGERVGVRGSLPEVGDDWTRGGSPSPEFELRSNSTSPRKRGEVKEQLPLRKQRRLLPRRTLLGLDHRDRGHVEDAARGDARGEDVGRTRRADQDRADGQRIRQRLDHLI